MLAKKKSRVIGALLWPRYGRSKHDKDVPVVSAYKNLMGFVLCRGCDMGVSCDKRQSSNFRL